MAVHSSILGWKIPWTEEPGGLQSVGSQALNATQRLNHRQDTYKNQYRNVKIIITAQFSHSVGSLSVTPWTAACQASPSITNSWSLLKLMSLESVMPSNHLILCHPLLLLPSIFPSIRVFSNESVLHIGGQSIGVSASASVLLMNIQD